jgi:hypothetical protein
MGEITGESQAELRCSIVERLAAAQKSAPLSRRLVGEAAAACGVSKSTMWRWIARSGPTPRAWRGAVPSERAVELLLQGVGTSRRCIDSLKRRARRFRRGARSRGRSSGG